MAKTATTKKNTKTDNRLCVLSALIDGDDWYLRPMVYGDGKIRTYLPNRLDGRIKPFKVVKTKRALVRHLFGKNSMTPVIAKVVHVQDLSGWSNRRFAAA